MKHLLILVLCLTTMLFMGVTAVAEDDPAILETGARPITESVAKAAMAYEYGTTVEYISANYVFTYDSEQMLMFVYTAAPADEAELIMYIYYDTEGYVCSTQGWRYLPDMFTGTDGDGAEVVPVGTTVTESVVTVFSIAGKAFDFFLGNPLCALVLGVSFAFAALSLIRRGMAVAKRS